MRNSKPRSFATLLKKCEKEKFYLDPTVRIESFARDIKTNRTYLSDFLHRVKKTSFSDYVNDLRIAEAIPLLDSCKYHHTEVSKMVGFTSEYTFRRVFKNRYGMTPRDYLVQKQLDKGLRKYAKKKNK